MIILYSGTPGSGKSLHSANDILNRIKFKQMTIGNFPISIDSPYYKFVDKDLTVPYLIEFSREYFCRDFQRHDRDLWVSFFTQHRHLGYDIIFMCQFERMLDRQIRSLIEYEYIHKKVSNFGWRGVIISLLALSPGNLFVYVKIWSPLKEKVESGFFKYKRKLGKLYDTNRLFDNLRDDFKEGKE